MVRTPASQVLIILYCCFRAGCTGRALRRDFGGAADGRGTCPVVSNADQVSRTCSILNLQGRCAVGERDEWLARRPRHRSEPLRQV